MSEIIEAPPLDIKAEVRNLDFYFLEELAFEAASLWHSCEQAALRGDPLTFSVHLKQVRLVTFTAVKHLEEVLGKARAQ